jgi:hypothetical protein
MDNAGRKTVAAIKEELAGLGLHLGMNISEHELVNKLVVKVDELVCSQAPKNPTRARTLTCLKYHGIDNVFQLVQLNADDLLKIKNFGQECLKLVEAGLASIGLSLGMLIDEKVLRQVKEKIFLADHNLIRDAKDALERIECSNGVRSMEQAKPLRALIALVEKTWDILEKEPS